MFDNKVSILSAQSGQLISLGSKKLKNSGTFFAFTKAKKIVLASLLLLGLIVISLMLLQQRQSIDFSALIEQNFNENNEVISNFVLEQKETPKILSTEVKSIKDNPQVASREDILQAIFTVEATEGNARERFLARSNAIDSRIIQREPEADKEASKAQKTSEPQITSQEMANTISADTNYSQVIVKPVIVEPEIKEVTFNEIETQPSTPDKFDVIDTARQTNPSSTLNNKIDGKQYLDKNTGFVVQIAGFSQLSVFEEFINEYSTLDYLGYYRNLNQQKFLVITSPIYPSRAAAEQALLSLPILLQERGSWVKSLEAVNSEIQQYQQSN
jgi:DamX protein